ncbi:MAG: hypothetical protein LV481_00055 [Methylacidiphilales bacterium]|nr:hypothetical protein [Candidatus Methylacidiphilales bacterium]
MKRISQLGRLWIWAKYYIQMWRAQSLMPGLERDSTAKAGHLRYKPKNEILYLGKPVIFNFLTESILYVVGDKGFFLEGAIPLSHARQASEVLEELPRLLPIIDTKIKEEWSEFEDQELMEQELSDPEVVFNSSPDGHKKPRYWTFEVDRDSMDMSHIVRFHNFEVTESYGVG